MQGGKLKRRESNRVFNWRTDLYISANILLLAIMLVAVLFVWYKAVFMSDVNFFHVENSLGSILLLSIASLCGIALLNSLLLMLPSSRKNLADQSAMSEQTVNLHKQATTDPLTGMHNRRYFEDAMKGYLTEFNKIGSSVGLLILDLDHFKSVNDNYGHDVGDMVLREVALRMQAISREHDIVARLGGEEFAVITPYLSMEKLINVAERYRAMVEALKVNHGNVIIRPTISIGVATSEGGKLTADDLFKAADKKLYEAKNSGRNRVAA